MVKIKKKEREDNSSEEHKIKVITEKKEKNNPFHIKQNLEREKTKLMMGLLVTNVKDPVKRNLGQTSSIS